MSDYVLFQMSESLRQSLIEGHLFYVEQAQKRLLSQFDNIEADADRAAKKWLEQNTEDFHPDRDNPEDFYEMAYKADIEFYGLLSGMYEQTRLSVVAGMFHEWEKQLRHWLVDEMQRWHSGDKAALKIWSADFGKIADLLESFGWNIRNTDYFRTLNACRLVVNVYKHGKGSSLYDLKNHFPEYLDDPLKDLDIFLDKKYLDHTHVKINDVQFQAFTDGILEFWRNVPVKIFQSQINNEPAWFYEAIKKDRNSKQADM